MSVVQSLSVVVPTKGCINKCGFCVSRMRQDDYPNIIGMSPWSYTQHSADYLEKMAHAREKGCDTVMLTGTGEPQQNKEFLTHFGYFLRLMEHPFRIVEMQTTGVGIDESYLHFLRQHVKVNTISLSLSALDSVQNALYNGTPEKNMVNIHEIVQQIRQFGFNLRLSLNLTDYYKEVGNYSAIKLFKKVAQEFSPDQVTLRVLYASKGNSPQNKWIKEHGAPAGFTRNLRKHIEKYGKKLEILDFGATRYSLQGMSIVLDDDCMSTEAKLALKYFILRPNIHLYSKWDDPASLIV